MGLLQGARNVIDRMRASYEGVKPSKNRKATTRDYRSEDRILDVTDRDKMIAACRDLRRNHPVVADAVRKHVNYVAKFNFQAHSLDDAVNTQIEALMEWWARPLNCDASGRHGFQQLLDLIEGLAVTDGDVFVAKIRDGRLQIVESDRVRTPDDFGDKAERFNASQFVHGVNQDSRSAAKRYAICERVDIAFGAGAWKLKAILDSGELYQHGYFDRYDQLRGISLLAPAINDFKDIHEAKQYALAKMKVSQFAAMARTSTDDPSDPDATTTDIQTTDDGVKMFELAAGEDIKVIESANPSTQFQAFMVAVKMDGLKALSQPYSFYDEKWTNYSGARNALQQYDQISNTRRDRLRNLLNAITAWRLQLFIDSGDLVLPEGWTIANLKWEWVSQGMPWIDPQKEATAKVLMIEKGLASNEDTCRESGQDWYAIQDKLAAEKAYRDRLGLATTVSDSAAGIAPTPAEEANTDQENESDTGEDDGISEAA